MTTALDKALLMERHAYQISHLIAGFTVPLMRNLYHQFDGDMVQMIVLGEISLHNVSQFFRKGGADVPEKLLDDMARRGKLMHSCNVLSISEATGIPRETVRRKVAQLLKKGLLYRDEHKRLMVRSGVSAGFSRRNAKTTQEILELAAKLQALLKNVDTEQD
jgi:predicted transcriptional regulator